MNALGDLADLLFQHWWQDFSWLLQTDRRMFLLFVLAVCLCLSLVNTRSSKCCYWNVFCQCLQIVQSSLIISQLLSRSLSSSHPQAFIRATINHHDHIESKVSYFSVFSIPCSQSLDDSCLTCFFSEHVATRLEIKLVQLCHFPSIIDCISLLGMYCASPSYKCPLQIALGIIIHSSLSIIFHQ